MFSRGVVELSSDDEKPFPSGEKREIWSFFRRHLSKRSKVPSIEVIGDGHKVGDNKGGDEATSIKTTTENTYPIFENLEYVAKVGRPDRMDGVKERFYPELIGCDSRPLVPLYMETVASSQENDDRHSTENGRHCTEPDRSCVCSALCNCFRLKKIGFPVLPFIPPHPDNTTASGETNGAEMKVEISPERMSLMQPLGGPPLEPGTSCEDISEDRDNNFLHTVSPSRGIQTSNQRDRYSHEDMRPVSVAMATFLRSFDIDASNIETPESSFIRNSMRRQRHKNILCGRRRSRNSPTGTVRVTRKNMCTFCKYIEKSRLQRRKSL